MEQKLLRMLSGSLLAGALAVAGAAPAAAQSKQPDDASIAMPKVGDIAPDFTLKYFDGNDLKAVSLSQYRGKKNVVVAFFIFAFTGG
jgi:cytochrome oxidase Cu insertion factor (SCO1/SenC/PrrC family)